MKLFDSLPWVVIAIMLGATLLLAGVGGNIGPDTSVPVPLLLGSVGVALGVLGALLARQCWKLWQGIRSERPGARLQARLLGVLLALALPPLLIMYILPLRYLYGAIDSRYSVDVSRALESALSLGQDVLSRDQQQALRRLDRVAEELIFATDPNEALEEQLEPQQALELSLFERGGRLQASASADPRFLLPRLPEPGLLTRVQREDALAELEGNGAQAVVLALKSVDGGVLIGRFAPTPGLVERIAGIEAEAVQYRQLEFLRRTLKYTLTVVLSLVLVAGLMLSFHFAFLLSRRLTAPIARLAGAARQIAGGDLNVRVPEQGRDELGFLARDFNRMARELAEARSELLAAAEREADERAFLELVLARLSSGVLVIDRSGHLRSANASALHMLGGELGDAPDSGHPPLTLLARERPALGPLFERITEASTSPAREWRGEIALTLAGQQRLLLVRTARLGESADAALVVLIEDQSEVGRAQRDSAWAEVARRLAHEIKNPLTPIQLSAERLKLKLGAQLDDKHRELLDRSVTTIVAQVETLKTMVNAFSEYGRAPRLTFASVDLGVLLGELADLYEAEAVDVRLELPEHAPRVRGDAHRLRQLFQNLIKNAVEAVAEGQNCRIWIRLRAQQEGSRAWIEIELSDNGPGIPDALRHRLFEPYTTSKPKGTGLGLAIVMKIVEEHGGQIQADNAPEGGARIRLRLPLMLG